MRWAVAPSIRHSGREYLTCRQPSSSVRRYVTVAAASTPPACSGTSCHREFMAPCAWLLSSAGSCAGGSAENRVAPGGQRTGSPAHGRQIGGGVSPGAQKPLEAAVVSSTSAPRERATAALKLGLYAAGAFWSAPWSSAEGRGKDAPDGLPCLTAA